MESLEDRTLLTVSSAFDAISGVLTVNADAADNVLVTAAGGNVLVNGLDPDSGVLAATAVLQIDVLATGDFSNTFDLSAVTPADFSSLIINRLVGAEGDDILIGSELDDALEGGDGSDQLTGGPGNDRYEFFISSGSGNQNDVIDETGGGIDYIGLFTETGGATLDLSIAGAQSVTGGASALTLTLGSGSAIEDASANLGGNLLTGNALNNRLDGGGTLIGGPGNDVLAHGGGGTDDTFIGGAGDDTYEFLDGSINYGVDTIDETGGGTDTLLFQQYQTAVTLSAGATGTSQAVHANQSLIIANGSTLEVLVGGAANDSLTAAPGVNTTLRGLQGDDTLIGNTGNDILEIDEGQDILRGGAGDDTYASLFDSLPGADLIDESSGSGVDTIDFAAYENSDGTGVTIDLDSSAVQTYRGGAAAFTLAGAVENVIGSVYPDTISIDSIANVSRAVAGLSPSTVPGDALYLDLMHRSFTHSPGATGDGTYEVNLTGGAGTVSYTSIESLNLQNPPSPPVSDVYVDDNFAGMAPGASIADADPNTVGSQAATFGVDAFATIQEGVDAVAVGGNVFIVDGLYEEFVTIEKRMTIDGTSPDRDAVRISGAGVWIQSGGDAVTLRDVHVMSGLRATSVIAPTLENIHSTGSYGFYGRGLTGTLAVSDSLVAETGTAAFDVAVTELHVVIEDTIFRSNSSGPFSITGAAAVTLRDVDFRDNTGGVKLTSIGALTYDTAGGDIRDEIDFDNNVLSHRKNGVDRSPLELLGVQDLQINTFGGEDHVAGRTHAAMTVTVDTGNNLTGDTITIEGTAVSDLFSSTITGSGTEIRNGTHALVTLRGMEHMNLLGHEGADEFDVEPTGEYSIFVDGGDPVGVNGGGAAAFDTVFVNAVGQQITHNGGPEADDGSIVAGNLLPVSYDRIEFAQLTFAPDPDAGLDFGFRSNPFGSQNEAARVVSEGDGRIKVSSGILDVIYSDLTPESIGTIDLRDSSQDVVFDFNGETFAQNFTVLGGGDNDLLLEGGGPFDEATIDLQDDGTVQVTINPTITLNGVSGLFINSTLNRASINGTGNADTFTFSDVGLGKTEVAFPVGLLGFSIDVRAVLPLGINSLSVNGNAGADDFLINGLGRKFAAALSLVGGAGHDLVTVPNNVSVANSFTVDADKLVAVGEIDTYLAINKGHISIQGGFVEVDKLWTDGGDITIKSERSITLNGELRSGGGAIEIVAAEDVVLNKDASLNIETSAGGQRVSVVAGDGSGAAKVNGPLTTGGSVELTSALQEGLPYAFSGNNQFLVYGSDETTDDHFEIYRYTPTTGPQQIAVQTDRSKDGFKVGSDLAVISYPNVPTGGQLVGGIDLRIGAQLWVEQAQYQPIAGFVFSPLEAFRLTPDESAIVSQANDGGSFGVTSGYLLHTLRPDRSSSAQRTFSISRFATGHSVPNVLQWGISPDSKSIYVVTNGSRDDKFQLYQTPVDGTIQSIIGKASSTDRDIGSFRLDRNSDKVVYLANNDAFDAHDLYLVSPTQTSPVKLTPPAGSRIRSILDYQITPDGKSVVYISDHDVPGKFELFTVSVTGGNSTKLNAAFAADSDVYKFEVSQDSKYVVYTADQNVDQKTELFSVPLAGGSPVQINASVPDNRDVDTFSISPDNRRIVYTANHDTAVRNDLYFVSIQGGTPIKLNSLPTTTGSVGSVKDFALSTDGNRIAYRAQQSSGAFDLYTAPMPGDIIMEGSVSINGRGAPVTLRAAGDVHLANVTTTSNAVVESQMGEIIDAGGIASRGAGLNVTAASASLKARNGIASDDLLEIQVSGKLAFENTHQGDVNITNFGELTIDSFDGLASSSNTNGDIALFASEITVGHDLTARNISISAEESSASATNNISIAAGATVAATDILELHAGDDLVVSPTAEVKADKLTLRSGYNNADTRGHMTLDGRLEAVTGSNKSIFLSARGAVRQSAGGIIRADNLRIDGSDSFILPNTSNDVATLWGNTGGAVTFKDVDTVSVGPLTTAGADVELEVRSTIRFTDDVHVGTGTLSIDIQSVATQASAANITAGALLLKGRGIYALTNSGNDVDVLAGDLLPGVLSAIAFTDRDGVGIGTVDGVSGLTAPTGVTVIAPIIRVKEDIQTHTGNVELQGLVVVAAANVTIDTGLGGAVSAGNVRLGNANLVADTPGRKLTIDTRSTGAGTSGGDVQMPRFSPDGSLVFAISGTRMLNELHVDSTGAVADGIIRPDQGIYLQSNGPNDLAALAIKGDVRLDHNTVFSTANRIGDAGSMDLQFARVYAANSGANLVLDASVTGTTGATGNGGSISLGKFEAPSGANEIEDLTVLVHSAGRKDGSITVNHDISVDGDLRFSGVVLLPNQTTSLSTSSSVDSAGSIDLRTATVMRTQAGAVPNLNLLAAHTGGLASSNHAGDVWTGSLTTLGDVRIDVNSNGGINGGRGGSVVAGVPGTVLNVTTLNIVGSGGDRNNPADVAFNSPISIGSGGLMIVAPDSVTFADSVTSSGPVHVEALNNVEFLTATTGIDATGYTNQQSSQPAIHLETRSIGGTIQLRGDLITEGTGITLDGDVVLHQSVILDSDQGRGFAGDITLRGDRLYPAKQGLRLGIDADAASIGGTVTVDSKITGIQTLGLGKPLLLRNFQINAHGANTMGTIRLGNDIQLGSYYDFFGRLQPSQFHAIGDVRLITDVKLDLSDESANGGSVLIAIGSVASAGSTSYDLEIDTRHLGTSSGGWMGGDVNLSNFVTDSVDAAVGQLSIDMRTSSLGGRGGNYNPPAEITLADGLAVATSAGTLLSPSTVRLNNITVLGSNGIEVVGPYNLNKTGVILSAGPVTFDAVNIETRQKIDATHNGRVSGNDVRMTARRIKLQGDIVTGGKSGSTTSGGIYFSGDVVVDVGARLSTSLGVAGPGGRVSFTNGQISGIGSQQSLGPSLIISTAAPVGSNDNGGSVKLSPLSNSPGGSYLNQFSIDASGAGTGRNGVIQAEAIRVGQDQHGTASSLRLAGDVVISRDIRFNASESGAQAGIIDLRRAVVSATQPNLDLTLEARQNDAASSADGGEILLGNFGNGGSHLMGNLIVDGRTTGSGTNGDILLGDSLPVKISTSDDQTYFGPVTVNAVSADLAAQDLTLTSTVNLKANTLVASNNGTSSEARDVISGTGNLWKRGGGTLKLDAVNTFSGETRIIDGVLSVERSAEITGSRVWINGGTLAGNGTVKGPVLMDPMGRGKISPGGTPGLLTVDGDVTFVDGGRFVVDLDSVGDTLEIIGGGRNVRLGDGLGNDSFLDVVFQTNPQVADQFTLIEISDVNAPPVTGLFKNVRGGIYALSTFRAKIDYTGGDGNDVVLTVLPTGSMAEVKQGDTGLITVGPSSGGSGNTGGNGAAGSGKSAVVNSSFRIQSTLGGTGIRISQPGSTFLLDGQLQESDFVDIPLVGRDFVQLVGVNGARELLLDLSGGVHDVSLEPQSVGGLVDGVIIGVQGFEELEILGDGNDTATFLWPTDPASPIRVAGTADGKDLVSRSGDFFRAGNWGIVTSGLQRLQLQNDNGGSGAVIFDVASLNGAEYFANLQQTDSVSLLGSDVSNDDLLIGRYGNAWHPTGIEVVDGETFFRIAGVGRAEIDGQAGDDMVTVVSENNVGLLQTPLNVYGGESFRTGDVLRIQSADGTATNIPAAIGGEGFVEVQGTAGISYGQIERVEINDRPIVQAPTQAFRTALPLLDWQPMFGQSSYEVELVNQTAGTNASITVVTDSFFQPASPLAMGRYSFRVRGIQDAGGVTEFSDPVSFDVRPRTSIAVASRVTNGTPQIQWAPVEGALRYDLWISNNDVVGPPVIRERFLTETQFTPIHELPIGRYSVYLRPHGENGYTGTWTGTPLHIATPTTIAAPTVGTLDGLPTFAWEPVAGAQTYDLWVRQLTPDVTDQLIRIQDLTETTYATTMTLPNAEFIFWVQAQASNGFQSSWSSPARFTTFARPAIEGPTSNNAEVDSAISWSAVHGATSYELEVTDGAGNVVINESALTNTNFQPATLLDYGAEYSVRARAIKDGLPGVWSPVHRFLTPADRVTLIGPTGTGPSEGLPPGSIRFLWNGTVGTAGYELWVNQIDGPGRVVHERNLTSTEFNSSALKAGRYRFWVRAINAAGRAGGWSSALEFTVADAAETSSDEAGLELLSLCALGRKRPSAELVMHDSLSAEPMPPSIDSDSVAQQPIAAHTEAQRRVEQLQVIDATFEDWESVV